MFYSNYSGSAATFYYPEKHTFDYGPGFGLTLGAGVSLLISAGIGVAMFVGMVKGILKDIMESSNVEVRFLRLG